MQKRFLGIMVTSVLLAMVFIACKDDDKEQEKEKEGKKQEEVDNSGRITSFTVNGVSFDMVFVKGGTFTMGAAQDDSDAEVNEKPAHQVTLSDFSIGKFTVTQKLWEAVMGNNPSWLGGDDLLPVETVSWNDAQEFISKLNTATGKTFRLPTEAEWEYAARGGSKSKGYKYSGSNDINAVAWYAENREIDPHPVGTKAPNELGIYDMSGNVWEWCNDWYAIYTDAIQTNPQGAESGCRRVLRGCTWHGGHRNYRVSFRSNAAPDLRHYIIGLRLSLIP